MYFYLTLSEQDMENILWWLCKQNKKLFWLVWLLLARTEHETELISPIN